MDYSRLRTVFTDITVFSLPVIFIFFAAKRYFPLFVPFVFALLMVLMLTPLNNALKKKSPPVIAAVICTLTAAAVFVFLIYFTLNYALKGLYSFADALPSIYTSSEAVFTKISARFSFLGNKARNPSDFTVFFYQKGAAALHNAVSGFFKDSADFILSALKNIPSFVITVFTAFLSAFFILLDGEKISAFFKKTVPPQTFLFFCKIKNTFCGAVFMYIKAAYHSRNYFYNTFCGAVLSFRRICRFACPYYSDCGRRPHTRHGNRYAAMGGFFNTFRKSSKGMGAFGSLRNMCSYAPVYRA